MKPLFFATRAHLLVCVGPQCSKRGSRELLARATSHLETQKLAYYKEGGSIRLTATACLGACAHGPNLTAYFGDASGTLCEAWYSGVDDKRLSAIASALHEGNDPPDEGRYDQ
jgi:(2Fe-2S) ferredoxin